MSRKVDRTGHRCNMLIVTRELPPVTYPSGYTMMMWECKCDCGNYTRLSSAKLAQETQVSCGCKTKELIGNKNRTHGLRNTRTYKSWSEMRARCTNKNHNRYHTYAGRGIKVCERWMNSFENFYADMGDRPKNTSLDRIDNNGDYCPENCQWSDYETQGGNTTRTINIEIDGDVKCLSRWVRDFNMPSDREVYRKKIRKHGTSQEILEKVFAGYFKDYIRYVGEPND